VVRCYSAAVMIWAGFQFVIGGLLALAFVAALAVCWGWLHARRRARHPIVKKQWTARDWIFLALVLMPVVYVFGALLGIFH
jgi:hypothetical protein